MTIDTQDVASPLMQKFHAFYELFNEFTNDAVELHGNLPVHDDASRAAFSSLSRILAFADQLNILTSLMREDVRLVDDLSVSPVAAKWADEIDHTFYEWLKASKTGAPNVN
jgi:hypothetical protein